MTNSEKIVSLLSQGYFYSEFTYNDLVFTITGVGDLEFSDTVIKFNDRLLLIQIKEKTSSTVSPETWFKNNIKLANKQHKDTLKYINDNPDLSFSNNCGNVLNINELKNLHPIFLTIFVNDEIHQYEKIKISQHIGTYNIFSHSDFELVCQKLITPLEILNYLQFRINFLSNYNTNIVIKNLPNGEIQIISIQNEEDLINAYLWETYEDNLEISHNCEFFRYILGNYKSKIYDSDKDYYSKIIEVLMRLNRKEINLLSERLQYEIQNEFTNPLESFRFMILDDFGILLMKTDEFIKKRSSIILQDFKYCKKLNKALLIETIKKGNEFIMMWLYTEFPYAYDGEEEEYAKKFETFLPSSKSIINN